MRSASRRDPLAEAREIKLGMLNARQLTLLEGFREQLEEGGTLQECDQEEEELPGELKV